MGALSHIRVLDLSRVLAAPWATQILGDLGAEVIKIEKPGEGDETRHFGPPFLKAGRRARRRDLFPRRQPQQEIRHDRFFASRKGRRW